jgi:transposase
MSGIPLELRSDFDASKLRAAARQTKDGPQTRRLLTLAAIYDGATCKEAVRIRDVTVRIVRHWVESSIGTAWTGSLTASRAADRRAWTTRIGRPSPG